MIHTLGAYMILLDGKLVASEMLTTLKREVAVLHEQKIEPTLHVVVVGSNRVVDLYVKQKSKTAKKIGIKIITHKVTAPFSTQKVVQVITRLNAQKNCHGIIVQLPLPEKVNTDKVIWAIAPHKDVDGFQMRLFRPPTPSAILDLLTFYHIPVMRKKVTIIGNGRLVGKPLSVLMQKRGAHVSVCTHTTRDIASRVRNADIIVSAAGVPGCVAKNMVHEHHVIVDAGTSSEGSTIHGDVAFADVAPLVSAISSTPGGVGPVTVAELLKNVVIAARTYGIKESYTHTKSPKTDHSTAGPFVKRIHT